MLAQTEIFQADSYSKTSDKIGVKAMPLQLSYVSNFKKAAVRHLGFFFISKI